MHVDERGDVLYPSLLHFAADHNLQKFSAVLLTYPGMLTAALTENKDGDYPSTMASKKGYTELESDLIQFVQDQKVENVELRNIGNTPSSVGAFMSLLTSVPSFVRCHGHNLYQMKKILKNSFGYLTDKQTEYSGPQAKEKSYSFTYGDRRSCFFPVRAYASYFLCLDSSVT